MQKIVIILAIVGLRIFLVLGQECNVCQSSNDASCVNQTHFYNCMRGAITGTIQKCPENNICTNSNNVCVEESEVDDDNIRDVCGGNGEYGADCKTCSKSNKYTCVSSTQYSRCVGTTLSTTVFDCGVDEFCVLDALTPYNTICMPNCTLSFLSLKPTCSNIVDVTTTTAAPTTAADYTNVCNTAVSSSSNLLYFKTKNTEDATCQSYIYCERSSATASFSRAIYINCSTATPYFNSVTNKCESTKPSNC